MSRPAGFGTVKMRVGIIDGDPRHSARRVHAARAALGPDIGLMCDAHGTFSVAEAKRFCRLVEDCNLAWFEEPVTADDKAGCAEVRAATDIPIAAGESEFTRHDFRDLAMLGAVDILQPDLAICGGITEAMRISALASAHNLKLAPHLWAGAPAFAAGLHVAAASPAGFIVEYSLGANPLLHDLVEELFPVAGRGDRDPRPARPRHNRARGFPRRPHGEMKALFLGNVAADTANGIKDRLPPGLSVEILADPQQLMRSPDAAASADILVTNHWRAEYPPAARVKLVQSVATGIELIDLAALPPRRHCLQRLRPRDGDRRIHPDGHAGLEPPIQGNRGRLSHPFLMAPELGAERRAAWRDPRQHSRHRWARPGRL